MSGSGDGANFRELFARSLTKIVDLKSQLEKLESAAYPPIAVIGMACRFPGGGVDPEAFWQALAAGVDGIGHIPLSRWTLEAPDSTHPATRWAGLLDSVDGFDAPFFGMSPREAIPLDPQQRLLLELSWEALEQAGQTVERLMGTRTGVFMGMSSFDYPLLVLETLPRDVYSALGGLASTAAGRISYTFGLQGPCTTLDTACSSSLTAVHLACQSLRSGESDLALAGGVTLILGSKNIELTAQLQAMSPEGRCKTFDAEANGFALGEGGGIVVLKRAADAARDGDPILAVIRSSAVNQDGRSTGLTVPNVLAQQSLLQQSLELARLTPEDIGYVETHGTGTPLGDPIEFAALRAVLGQPRADGGSCVLGAVKTSIGHLGAAAGVAGLIKAILCLQRQAIPPNLNFRTLNPRISLEGTPFVLPTQTIPWKPAGKPRRAGVSSFGISGTNAHVIVEEAPRPQAGPVPQQASYLLPLSAKSPEALVALARSYKDWLGRNSEVALHHVAYTASVRRSHLEHRLCVVGATSEEIAASLGAFAAGEAPAAVMTGQATKPPKLVLVFSGQGSQWAGMGRQLYLDEPVFRDALAACDDALGKDAGFSIIAELARPAETSRLGETAVAQPALFALEVALAALLRAWGIVPAAVIGHSVGEVAAAHVAGMLDLAEAARLIVLRARIMHKATGHGKMVSVALTEEEARKTLGGLEARVGIAAVNDPESVVLSGDSEAMDALVERLAAGGVATRALRVDYAFHSPQMEPLAAEFTRALGTVRTRPGSLAMLSTVTGRPVLDPQLDAAYWGRNIRQTVRFAEAMTAAASAGSHLFVEVGPHPVLAVSMEQTLALRSAQSQVVSTLRREKDERRSAFSALGVLYAQGCGVDWKALFPQGGQVVPSPMYPWQRQRYWVSVPAADKTQAHALPESRAELLYAVAWRLTPEPATRASTRPGICLLFTDATGVGESLSAELAASGQSCVRVVPGSSYAALGPGLYRIDPGQPEDYRRVLREALVEGQPCIAAIHLWSLDATPLSAATDETLDADLLVGTLSAAYLAAALALHDVPRAPKLCLVSRGAHLVSDDAAAVSIAQVPLWGLGRTIALEHPELAATIIDLPQLVQKADIERLAHEVVATDGQTQVALRSSGRYGAQLVRASTPSQPAAELSLQADASYLITGGLGDLGRALARWLVEKGARNLVLVSRRPPSEEGQRAIAALEAAGVRILVIFADVSQREEVARMMALLAERMPPLRGVVHAAGLVQATPELTRDSLLAVAAPKVRGAFNLHAATRELALDFFVMYSSASSILGLIGGAGYAAANAFLDGLAEARRGLGLPALSVQWGPFGEAGMLVSHKGEMTPFGALEPLMLAEAHQALARLLDEPRAAMSVMRLSVARHFLFFPQLAGNFFWSALQGEASAPAKKPVLPADHRFREKLLTARPARRTELLTSHLREALAHTLRIEPEKITATATFHALGMDSLMSLELRSRLEADLGIRIPIKDILASGKLDTLVALLKCRVWPDDNVGAVPAPFGPGSWVVVPRPNPQAKLRLICFPYAGGNASVYTPWLDLLPAAVELCAIQAPGRQERVHEPLLQTVEEMVAALVPELLPYLDRPFVMFGHCIGAMVMYETMRELGDRHGLKPLHIFPSGAMPPPQYLLPPVLTSAPKDEFVGILRLLGFASESILSDDESVRDLLPAVSADFDVAIRYVCASPRRLDMPITLFCGREDQLGPPDRTAAWKDLTTGRFEQVVFPGEHYFITPERGAMLRVINEELLHYVAMLEQRRAPASWVRVPAPRRTPALRLFCFPGAWEAPAVFDAWPARLGEEVEVCVIERPGYGARRHELPLRRVDDIVDFVTSALEPYLDRPFAFLGHNVGSIMMFEVARSLRRAGKPMPLHLFVAATDAPHLYWSGPIHLIPTERIHEGLRLVHVSVDAELPEHMLRADSTVLASYTYAPEAPLEVPITAVIGEEDHFVPRGAVRGWKDATRAPFHLHIIAADHDLIRGATDFLVDLIQGACRPGAAAEPAALRGG